MQRGYITVDDSLATNVPGIWALGDCNGRGAFTHTAYNDFEIVAANLLDGENRKVSARIPAYALYTDPPLGRVGMTEAQARETGRPLLKSIRPMTRVGRAVEKGETQGFMKVVADAETRKILGAAILGTGGDEAIHGVLDIMNAGVSLDVLRWAVPIHPTVSELIPTLLLDLKPGRELESLFRFLRCLRCSVFEIRYLRTTPNAPPYIFPSCTTFPPTTVSTLTVAGSAAAGTLKMS